MRMLWKKEQTAELHIPKKHMILKRYDACARNSTLVDANVCTCEQIFISSVEFNTLIH